MTESIDHAAEAQKALGSAAFLAHLHGGTPGPGYHFEKAQVHATLALVEQQRIANLIAIAGLTSIDDSITISPLEQEAWEALGAPVTGEMHPEIRKALGLA